MSNLGNQITGYDMVTAITQSTINMQFALLWPMLDAEHQTMKWNSSIPIDKKSGLSYTFKFEGKMDAPEVILGTSLSPNFQVKLCINIPSGTLTYGVIETESVAITNWKYVFDVGVNFVAIEQERIKNNMAVPKVVKDMLDYFTDEQFTIRHLFMNFQDANIANYDSVNSKLTLPEGIDNNIIAFFQTGVTNYFKGLADTANPYILGYGIEENNPNSDPSIPPTFTPTSGTYWIFRELQEADQTRSALHFLIATNGRRVPDRTTPQFSTNWVVSNTYDGQFVVAKDTFFGEFILPKLKYALDQEIKGYGQGDDSFVDTTGPIEWKAAELPSQGKPHWKYTYDHTWTWDARDYVDSGIRMTANHSLQNSYWFTIDLENLLPSKAVIKLNGHFYVKDYMKATPLGIVTEMWAITQMSWDGTITLEGGTQGVVKLISDIKKGAISNDKDGNWAGDFNLALLPENKQNMENMGDWITKRFGEDLSDISSVLGAVNNRFVMPAGGVFSFVNPQFDDYQNLTMDITYKTQQ